MAHCRLETAKATEIGLNSIERGQTRPCVGRFFAEIGSSSPNLTRNRAELDQTCAASAWVDVIRCSCVCTLSVRMLILTRVLLPLLCSCMYTRMSPKRHLGPRMPLGATDASLAEPPRPRVAGWGVDGRGSVVSESSLVPLPAGAEVGPTLRVPRRERPSSMAWWRPWHEWGPEATRVGRTEACRLGYAPLWDRCCQVMYAWAGDLARAPGANPAAAFLLRRPPIWFGRPRGAARPPPHMACGGGVAFGLKSADFGLNSGPVSTNFGPSSALER